MTNLPYTIFDYSSLAPAASSTSALGRRATLFGAPLTNAS